MKFATYLSSSGPRTCVARDDEAGRLEFVDLLDNDAEFSTSVERFLFGDSDAVDRVNQVAKHGFPMKEHPSVFLPPITAPQKILCIGLNYADHAAETGAKVGSEPVVFNKFPTTLRGAGEPIVLPPQSNEVDFEAELVVVIGRRGKNIAREDWTKYVAGYTCGNDVSARDWQKGKPGRQWLLGKSFDSFAPVGPFVVTPDEIADPHDLQIQLRLNGEEMQNSRTDQLIFRIDYLIAYLSAVCTLEPGDLIFTGTPPGVGMARKPPVFLQSGDTVEVQIDGVGTLCNPVTN